MTLVIILNFVLAIFVISVIVGGHVWAIVVGHHEAVHSLPKPALITQNTPVDLLAPVSALS